MVHQIGLHDNSISDNTNFRKKIQKATTQKVMYI